MPTAFFFDRAMKIDRWRQRIDEIDLELVELLNQRSKCAIEIGKIKEKLNIEIYDPEREKQVIHNVQLAARGPLKAEAVQRLFERIIDESRRAEREHRAGQREGPNQRKSRERRQSAKKRARK